MAPAVGLFPADLGWYPVGSGGLWKRSEGKEKGRRDQGSSKQAGRQAASNSMRLWAAVNRC